jgi:hypothetical protein
MYSDRVREIGISGEPGLVAGAFDRLENCSRV